MDFDFNSLSLKELRDYRNRIDKAIATYEDRRKQEAIQELEEAAQRMGFSLADLTGLSPVKKRKPAAAKYANPMNPAETWTGRGRKPRWIQEALDAGKTLEEMSI